jgi:transposase-like protein
MRRRPVVLVELGLVEQRYQAVLEVLNDGAKVTEVARRYGVSRSAVHEWLGKYAVHGLAGLVAMELWQMDVVGGVRLVATTAPTPADSATRWSAVA